MLEYIFPSEHNKLATESFLISQGPMMPGYAVGGNLDDHAVVLPSNTRLTRGVV
jgi:hypothetical protein